MAVAARTWAEAFREARESLGWSQLRAAVELDVHYRTIQEWERGNKEPQLRQVRRCAEVFTSLGLQSWDLPFLTAHIRWSEHLPADLAVLTPSAAAGGSAAASLQGFPVNGGGLPTGE